MFGLSFLNPFFLWGLAVASVPIIIHLIKRNRAIKLPFAAIRFLQMEPHQRIRSQRLKQILLLLMRITAMAILALAFARPYLKNVGNHSLWLDQKESAVILVDNSFSMAYENHFQTAIEEARKLLNTFTPGDQVVVMQFSESAKIIAETKGNFKALGSLLNERLKLSHRSTNYLGGIQAAEAVLLESPFEGKTIYLISDFQKSGWDKFYSHWKVQSGIGLNCIPVGTDDFSNVVVTDLRISGDDEKQRKGDILVRVNNFGNETSKSKVFLYINKKKIAERYAMIPAGEEKIVQFRKVRFPKTTSAGYVKVQSQNDKINLDNQYFFVFEKKSKSLILAVNGEPDTRDATKDELFFVERAVNLPNLAKYKLIKSNPKSLNNYDLDDFRVVLLTNIKDVGRETLERLNYYVRGGGGLIVALGDRVNPTIFNRLFRDLTPANLTNLAFSSLNREYGSILAEVDYQHPIFRPFSEPNQGDPSTAQFYQYFHTEPINSESVVARFDDGSPAILERKVGAGKVVLITSSLDTEWNNLPVKAIFLPMLYQIIQYVAAEKKGQKSFLVGQPVPLGLDRWNRSGKEKLFVQVPSGEKIAVKSNIFEQTEEPGIYLIRRGNRKQSAGYFAVNIDSKESDLTPIDPEKIKEKFVDTSGETEQVASITATAISDKLERRQKLWRFAILGVILILVGETWLANRTYR
ncbi:MAG: BatA domain-containing protein [bacterium]